MFIKDEISLRVSKEWPYALTAVQKTLLEEGVSRRRFITRRQLDALLVATLITLVLSVVAYLLFAFGFFVFAGPAYMGPVTVIVSAAGCFTAVVATSMGIMYERLDTLRKAHKKYQDTSDLAEDSDFF